MGHIFRSFRDRQEVHRHAGGLQVHPADQRRRKRALHGDGDGLEQRRLRVQGHARDRRPVRTHRRSCGQQRDFQDRALRQHRHDVRQPCREAPVQPPLRAHHHTRPRLRRSSLHRHILPAHDVRRQHDDPRGGRLRHPHRLRGRRNRLPRPEPERLHDHHRHRGRVRERAHRHVRHVRARGRRQAAQGRCGHARDAGRRPRLQDRLREEVHRRHGGGGGHAPREELQPAGHRPRGAACRRDAGDRGRRDVRKRRDGRHVPCERGRDPRRRRELARGNLCVRRGRDRHG